MKKIVLVTFGCAKNLVDSEVMAGFLKSARYAFVDDPRRAEIIILNTCGFVQPARDEADAGIRNALLLKKRDRGKKVIVTGCYPERSGGELRTRYPGVDAWTGVRDFDKILDIVEGRPFKPAARTFLYDHRSPRIVSTPSSWAYLKISEGCSHHCAFCSIPLIKGEYRSRPIPSIVAEARHLAARGIKEVNLVSQDTTYFGRDRGKGDGLHELLKALVSVRSISWIRLLYGCPEEVTDGLLEMMQETKICPYLDLPFQHSNPSILRSMKRSMTGVRALKLLDTLRKKIPQIAIRTSLIVGFPGEGGREFDELKTFVREASFDHLGVFTYSPEEGTGAHVLGDPVPAAVKQKRREDIMNIQAAISAGHLKAHVGRTLDVVIEGVRRENPNVLIGRTRWQAPEVDGVVFIRPDGRKAILDRPLRKVEITSSDIYDLCGKIVG
jgi:ribosomal protein S12 methylthiotransferase